jgi:hypothetical protein
VEDRASQTSCSVQPVNKYVVTKSYRRLLKSRIVKYDVTKQLYTH